MTNQEQIVALAQQIIALAQTWQTMWTTDVLNIRPTPSTAGAPVGSFPKGTAVQVEDAMTPGWKRIVAGPWTNYYLSAAYLSANRPT